MPPRLVSFMRRGGDHHDPATSLSSRAGRPVWPVLSIIASPMAGFLRDEEAPTRCRVQGYSASFEERKGRTLSCHFSLVSCDLSMGTMGGSPVQVEPNSVGANAEVISLLDQTGITPFLRQFKGHDEKISLQFASSWDKGSVTVEGVCFDVSAKVISEASGLPNSGRRIWKDQTNQAEEMKKFLSNKESFR